GQEMQHDTSPHDVKIGGKKIRVQCASLVLAYSRMLYAQVYPTFNRFYCKNFLSEGVQYFRGAAKFCMVDNTNVVRASGTGKSMVPKAEMAAFSERFNFKFIAHAIGDANRSARVENPFYYIENNFYKGRTFTDLDDLNQQLFQWCKKVALNPLGNQPFSRMDLYQTERLHLQKLPIHIPEVYALHSRIVNLEGNVQLHENRYSVPDELLGRRVEVRESIDKVRVFDGHKLVAEHPRSHEGARTTVAIASHRTEGRRPLKGKYGSDRILPEEKTLRAAAPEIDAMVTAIRKEGRSRTSPAIKRLYRLYLDYPTEALCKACERALEYGLTDLSRIERMVLRNVAGDYFPFNITIDFEEIDHE
ncbi:IS21 family transposase, partial [Myxococcota bacterium]|nr:IS21 family transposase [Myxococcota bacterium]